MTKEEREQAILSCSRQVLRVSKKIHSHLPKTIEIEDLLSVAWLGAIKAVDAFNPKLKVRLSTYAETRIRGTVLDYLRSIDPLSRVQRRRLKKIERETQDEEKLRYDWHEEGEPHVVCIDALPKHWWEPTWEQFPLIDRAITLEKILNTSGLSNRERAAVGLNTDDVCIASLARELDVRYHSITHARVRGMIKLRAAATAVAGGM